MIRLRPAKCSIDFHSAAASVGLIGSTGTFRGNIIHSPFALDTFLRDLAATLVDVLLEAFVKVQGAPGSHRDGDKHEGEGNDRKNCQGWTGDNVIVQTVSFDGVHANKLENEVCGSTKIDNLDSQHVSISSS